MIIGSLRGALWALIGAMLATALLGGCVSLPEGRLAVDSVGIEGTAKLDDDDVLAKIQTSPSPKFLGLFRGVVYDYAIFDPHALERDLARIERFYRARGYWAARARAGRITTTSDRHVEVHIVVEEGLPVVDHDLKIHGIDHLPNDVAIAARDAARLKLPQNEPFDEDHFKTAEDDVRRALTDRGYAYAKVTREVFVDVVHRVADAVFTVEPGEPSTFGPVTFRGLDPDASGPRQQEIPEAPLRRAMKIREGKPFSTSALETATQALLDLEVFTSVKIVPDLPAVPPANHVVPITVFVEPAKLRQLRLGGGYEFDQIKTDLHLLVGWEHHNFAGDLRDFTIEARPGVVLYPTRINNLVVPDRPLLEERLRFQLKQPAFLESRVNAFIRPELNVYPLLVKTNPSPDDPVVGYVEAKGAVGVDRPFGKLFASVSYNVQVENPFSYKGALDPALQLLVIAYPDFYAYLDLRDDRIRPHKGIYLGNDLQIAGGVFGGDAQDIKVQPEIRTYVPISKTVTFATRASIGLMFPSNYGGVVKNLSKPDPSVSLAAQVRDIETVFFRGFFSGGASTNRGFPIRGVAPHGIVPFLNPATASQQVAANCDPATNPNPDPSLCSIPIGGFSLWELSNELRVKISGPFSSALFCDMGDVSQHVTDIRITHLHLSCGLGARYETPVGPIRLDLGYRIQPLQVLPYKSEDAAYEADPAEGKQPLLFGALPMAIALGIGEAF